MNKIKILRKEEAQKIAAGEVVERPSNIVKEIIENSIDAKSSQISLFIENAGKKLIRIVDNGCGMSNEDAKLCFATHATSKIENLVDLEQISSFGFRGEALASISAVSKVTLKTRLNQNFFTDSKKVLSNAVSKEAGEKSFTEPNQTLGIKIEYSQNKTLTEEKISMHGGTDIEIKDLFYNIPARKKFLKQDDTEWNQILNIFQAFCLSNINIHFKLFKDQKPIINAPAVNDLNQRISQLWGHNFSQNLISLTLANPKHYKNSQIKFNGLISNHNFWRYGRHHIFFFVNNRYVKDKELSKALLKGYAGVLPPARFPAAFIFIKADNDFVDINVHPKKEEVRFLKPVTVTNYLQRLVKETLDNNVRNLFGNKNDDSKSKINYYNLNQDIENIQINNLAKKANQELNKANNAFSPSNKTINDKKEIESKVDTEASSLNLLNKEDKKANNSTQKASGSIEFATDFYNLSLEKQEKKLSSNILRPRILEYEKEQTNIYEDKNKQAAKEFKIIGQLFRTYILAQSGQNLLLIDQHDAHERVIYDKITKDFEKHQGTKLIFPEIIELNSKEKENIKLAQDFLNNQGIETEFLDKNQLVIKSSPPQIQNKSLKELIFEILEFIHKNEKLDKEEFRKKLNDKVHAQIACKSAIKAGDTLTFEQMEKIVKDLQKTTNPLTCPHGRPTTWVISQYQIEKQFKRKL